MKASVESSVKVASVKSFMDLLPWKLLWKHSCKLPLKLLLPWKLS